MSKDKQIEEIKNILCMTDGLCYGACLECPVAKQAEALYNAGYRKQNDEELIDKIATHFEKEDNWTKLKYSWNACGKSVQLRNMLRDAFTEAKMKGGAE